MRIAPMRTSIAAAVVAVGLALFGPAAIDSAGAAASNAGVHATDVSKASDIGARRHTRHYRHDAYRGYDRPYYDGRPDYYRPYPYVAPVPFFLGFGFGPWW
jgi:hypothetical protein